MKFVRATNFVFLSLMALILMPGEQQQAAGFDLHLFLLLPLLLIKLGLAAPIVLALLAKLLLLLVVKKKAIALPLLLSSSRSSDETTDGAYPSSSSSDLGRIKRSVDFMENVVGKTELTEEELLETILNMDTFRCGEKLLCEVAAAVAQKKKINEDEAAMINLFSESRATETGILSPAVKVYRSAIISGFRFNDCSARFPTCLFGRTLMMQLVHLVTGSVSEESLVTETAQDVLLNPKGKKSRKRKINPRFELPTSLKEELNIN